MAMSSLTPGVLFKTSGLNQRHTPTQITASTEHVKTKYRRASLDEKEWPPESPVAQVYDIRNTSSSLIILNNKMDKKSHLRVQSGRYKSSSDSGEDKSKPVGPQRHLTVNMTKSTRHVPCYDSSSPFFHPTPSRPHTSHSHHSSKHRYPSTPGKPQVTEWHHYSSQIDRPSRIYSAPPLRAKSAGPKKKSLEPPPCFSRDARWLLHPDMTYGQKKYMNAIARAYDVTDMKQLKQAQYLQLIYREQQRDFFTPEEYRKYLQYLSSERKRQFNTKPPPPTHYRTHAKKDTPHSLFTERPSPTKENSEIEMVKEAQPKQLAPKPRHERDHSHMNERGNGKKEDIKKEATARKLDDDSEYMMYSDHENSKREKTAMDRSKRPKSSKFRNKGEKERERKVSDSSSDWRDSEEITPDHKSEEKYWQQPAAPLKESEPDGSGLLMTEEGYLDQNGEAIEKVSSEQKKEMKKPSKNTMKVVDREKEPVAITYDREDSDGNKTRVYASPIEKGRKESIPVVKEEVIHPVRQSVVKDSLEESDEREIVIDHKWETMESDTTNKAHNSQQTTST